MQYLPNTSEILEVPIWVKREDLFLPASVGGSKARKLEFIFAEAICKRATDIITIGTTGSHHINATAILGKSYNFAVHGILLPQPFHPYSNNIYQNTQKNIYSYKLVQSIPQAIYNAWKLKKELEKIGKRTYFIFPGGSNDQGILAYSKAGEELVQDIEQNPQLLLSKNQKTIWDYQICILGTGGITAGLLTAKQKYPILPPILSVLVYPGFWNTNTYIRALTLPIRKYVLPIGKYNRNLLNITKKYLGEGYGTEDPKNREAVQIFEKDGVFLDPIYMARAGQTVVDLTKQKKGLNGLLLWHSSPKMRN